MNSKPKTIIVALAVTLPQDSPAAIDPFVPDYARIIKEYFNKRDKEVEVSQVAIIDDKCEGWNPQIFAKCPSDAVPESSTPAQPLLSDAVTTVKGPWGTAVPMCCARNH